eukprot:915249-Rhodomonas_salina.1
MGNTFIKHPPFRGTEGVGGRELGRGRRTESIRRLNRDVGRWVPVSVGLDWDCALTSVDGVWRRGQWSGCYGHVP